MTARKFTLFLGEARRVSGGPVFNSGYDVAYDVLGGPPELQLQIMRRGENHPWRAGAVRHGTFGWFGEFDTPENALAAIQAEIDGTT